ncbi:MAG: nucleotidyltransferase domain-containing protein [Candidatus Aminicenantes bacterium]|nr:nucleotidyltransferase domain-containing protein [Candidatus Aminicenantes bacterium]
MLKEKFKELQDKLLKETKSFYGNDLVSFVVFGSVARETFRFNSDIDILIIAENLPNGRMKRVKQFSAVEEKIEPFLESLEKQGIHTYISPVFKTPDEVKKGSPLFLDMVEDALILYDKDDFFTQWLKEFKARLKKLGAKRVWRGNMWYWVLKPDYKPGEVIEL